MREQLKSYLDQQVAEKEAADKERKMADEAYRAAMIARDERAVQLDLMEKECRKRLDQACFQYNRALVIIHKHGTNIFLKTEKISLKTWGNFR